MEAVLQPDGRLRFNGQTLKAAVGRGGIRADKQEGDGATPVGILPIRQVLYRADRVAPLHAAVPTEPIAPSDGWCDDPTHPDYNRQVSLPHPARCEELWRSDGLYDVIAVLGWNDAPAVKGRGSAIFLHVARPDLGPTEGCLALPLGELRRLLADGLTRIRIEQP